jgi:hypothetical protein
MSRYHRPTARWAKLLVGALFILASAGATYRISRPVYESQARISQIPTDGFNVPWPPSFIEAQSSVIQSPRVINAALSRPIWKATRDNLSARAFAGDMEIQPVGGMIQLRFRDTDPARADAAIRAICDGYTTVRAAIQQESLPKLNDINDRKRKLIGEIGQTSQDIFSAADECGAADLSLLRQAVSKKVSLLERALTDGVAENPESFRNDLSAQKATLSKIDRAIRTILALQAKRDGLVEELKPLAASAAEIEIANQYQSAFTFEPAASPVADNRRRDAFFAALLASLSFGSSWLIANRYNKQCRSLLARSSFPVITTPATSLPPSPHAADASHPDCAIQTSPHPRADSDRPIPLAAPP